MNRRRRSAQTRPRRLLRQTKGVAPAVQSCPYKMSLGRELTLTHDRTRAGTPGDCVYLPRGIMHCFQNTGKVEAKFLVMVTPAALESFFAGAFLAAEDRFAPPMMTEGMLGRLLTAARH